MKKILTTVVFAFAVSMVFAQLKVVAPNGDVGIGTSTPAEKLDVDGNAIVRGANLFVGQDVPSGAIRVEVGQGRPSNGTASFDFVSDASNFPDFGLRLQRDLNGNSRFSHRGGGPLMFATNNAGQLQFLTNNSIRFRVMPDGKMGVGRVPTTYELEISGDAGKTSGGTDWVAISDKRLKKNIKSFDDGLDKLMQINPVFFEYTGEAGTKAGVQYVGLIAQEMQEIAPYTVKKYVYQDVVTTKSGDDVLTEELGERKEYLSLDNTAVRYMLVNAVKEQQEMIDAQSKLIEALEERLAQLEATTNVEMEGAEINVVLSSGAELKQNEPNPFNEYTSISYALPSGFQSAQMNIFDMNGKLMKVVKLTEGVTEGKVNVRADNLGNGAYTYSLIVDGNVISSKKMLLTK